MEHATIPDMRRIDTIAQGHVSAGNPDTILEIKIETAAPLHDIVLLRGLSTYAIVRASRLHHDQKVIHITAADWIIVRTKPKPTPKRKQHTTNTKETRRTPKRHKRRA